MAILMSAVRWATDTLKYHNEDAFGSSRNTFWVIDGASSLSSSVSNADVSRFSAQISDGLREWAVECSEMPLAELVRLVHDLVLTEWSADPVAAIPTASIVVARVLEDSVETFSLGDCTGYVRRDADISEVSDPQFHNNEKPLLDQVRASIQSGIAPDQAYALLKPELLERRRRRNTPGGKWILGADSEAALHGRMESFPYSVDQPLSVILMTDGYRRAWDTYGLYPTLQEFLAQTENDPHEVLIRIRETEKTDPERTRYLRLSASDDATVCSTFGS